MTIAEALGATVLVISVVAVVALVVRVTAESDLEYNIATGVAWVAAVASTALALVNIWTAVNW